MCGIYESMVVAGISKFTPRKEGDREVVGRLGVTERQIGVLYI